MAASLDYRRDSFFHWLDISCSNRRSAQGAHKNKRESIGSTIEFETRLISPKPGHLLSQLTTPGGNQIGYTYAHGKPSGISVNGQALLSRITYEPHGPVSGWTWGNGLPHVRAHGLDGEVLRIESAVATTYGYDLAGQLNSQHLWSQTTPLQHDTQSSFSLDAAGRLSAAQTLIALPQGTISDSLAYGHDANGNRQSIIWNGIATQYAYSANRLAQSSGASNRIYAWDAAGRMTGDGFYSYTYNALGRLAAVSGGAGNLASYRYNALGQRVAKDAASGNVRFAYDEAGHLVGEYDSTGRTIQEIVWLEDLPVASIRPKPTGGTEVFYIHPDHLGTPRQITDSLNRMVWRWNTAEPFGTELPNEDPDGDGIRYEFNLRFPGQYYDKETGRHYNYFRDYDPTLGRYTTSDPIGLEGGTNRFAYVGGNPISRTDPTGLGYLDLAKCLVGFPDVAQAKNQCKKDCPANGKPEELVKWVDQYGGGAVDEAILSCACQKLGPGRCKEWIKTCFEGATYPTSPIKPKVKF